MDYCIERGDEVTVIDNFRTSTSRHLDNKKCRLVVGSIVDRSAVREAVRDVNVVFHLAALVSVDQSFQELEETIRINIDGLNNVAEEAIHAGVTKIVFASSASVYGNPSTIPQHEESIKRPGSPYARTKLDGESILLKHRESGRIDVNILRFFNVFGPRQSASSSYSAVIVRFIQQALAGDSLQISGSGQQTRDFVYVSDVAKALSLAARDKIEHGVVNVGSGIQVSIKDLAEAITELVGTKGSIIFQAERPNEILRSCGCNQRIKESGWRPDYSLREALELTIASYAQGK